MSIWGAISTPAQEKKKQITQKGGGEDVRSLGDMSLMALVSP